MIATDYPDPPSRPEASLIEAENRAEHQFQHEQVLGSSLELKVAAPNEAIARRAETAALGEIDRLTRILSSYDPTSEFSRWSAAEAKPGALSPEILEVLALFDRWASPGQGTLNAGSEVLSRLWERSARAQRVPTEAEIEIALREMDQAHWRLDPVAAGALRLGRCPLSLNAAGKGYVVDRAAAAALTIEGVQGVVLNIGGDLVVRGDISETIDIADPRAFSDNAWPIARMELRNAAVATSGDYRRSLVIGDRRYSHLFDTRTGRPVENVISATAIAPSAADADALATIFSILPAAESQRLAARLPATEFLLMTRDGQRVTSQGWSRLEKPLLLASLNDFQLVANDAVTPTASPSLAAATESAQWDPAFELVVGLQIPKITGGRYHRPFVAVWIEDGDKFPVRTIALWYNSREAKYLKDLKVWMESDKLREMAEASDIKPSISGATRRPGEYTVKWDGKDNAGIPVPAGQYTVLIEAAREDGTHQLIRQEMNFSGEPQKVELPTNVEVASAILEYHKKEVSP